MVARPADLSELPAYAQVEAAGLLFTAIQMRRVLNPAVHAQRSIELRCNACFGLQGGVAVISLDLVRLVEDQRIPAAVPMPQVHLRVGLQQPGTVGLESSLQAQPDAASEFNLRVMVDTRDAIICGIELGLLGDDLCLRLDCPVR